MTCQRAVLRTGDCAVAFGPLVAVREILGEAGALAAYDPPARAGLAAMAAYVRGFLMAEHPALGRPGAVCPFAGKAVEHDRIRLTACALAEEDEAALTAGLMALQAQLVQNPGPPHERAADDRAIIAVFPQLREPGGAALIERIQKTLKLSFVQQGLMLGQFFPSCPEPGLWNADFRPLQSPVISLAMRNITIFDAPFMLDRQAYIDAFVRIFGPAGAARIRQSARARGLPGAGGCPREAVAAAGGEAADAGRP